MSVNSYASIQALIADALARADLTPQIIDAITLFEAEAGFELFRTRGTEVLSLLFPSSGNGTAISGIISDGGIIQIFSTAHGFTTNQIAIVSNVAGTTEANGEWQVTVLDTNTVLLQNSTFVNAYVSGGTISVPAGQAALPSDYMGWRRVTWTGVPTVDLEYVSPAIWDEEFPTWLPIINTGIPEVFTIEAGYLKIKPVSTTPLEFLYWQNTPDLVNSFNWLATQRPDVYVAGALAIIYGLWVKDPAQAQFYNAKKMEIYDQIKKQRFREFNNLRVRMDRSSYGTTP